MSKLQKKIDNDEVTVPNLCSVCKRPIDCDGCWRQSMITGICTRSKCDRNMHKECFGSFRRSDFLENGSSLGLLGNGWKILHFSENEIYPLRNESIKSLEELEERSLYISTHEGAYSYAL